MVFCLSSPSLPRFIQPLSILSSLNAMTGVMNSDSDCTCELKTCRFGLGMTLEVDWALVKLVSKVYHASFYTS